MFTECLMKVRPSLYQLIGHNPDSAKEAALQVC
jgi:hypothetical protein